MIIPNYTNLNGGAIQEQSIKKNYPEFHKYLIETYPIDLPFKEKLYWYFKGLSDYPRCPVCGCIPKFENIKSGYHTYCSTKCSNSNPLKKEKARSTCLKKYGVDVPSKSDIFKWKTKQTNLERYGVENAMQNKDIAEKSYNTNMERYGGMGNSSEILLNRYKQTNLEKYGVENPGQSEELRKKVRKTLLERYGVDHQSKLVEVRDKISKSRKLNTLTKYDDVITWQDEQWLCKCPNPSCNKCQEKIYLVPPSIYRDRKRDHTERCTKLLKVQPTTIKGTTIELFIRDILDSYNIEYSCNARNIISPKELDIYIPSKKIAIECNGTYWHSTKFHMNSSHQNKYKSCLKEGVQLLTFWEDWIFNKPDIVQSILLSKLGIYKERIYARQCSVAEITPQSSHEFMNKNHIQGDCKGGIRLGLFYKNQLYGVMIFNKKKDGISGNAGWELARFCTNLNTQVVGGAAKLLNHFIKKYHPESIYSFSSNDISTGHLYETLGFAKGPINQSYWYIESGTYKRYHRSSFTKDSIVRRGWKPNKDGWKETDVMYEHGYYQIYDSGQTKWVLTLND